LDNERGECNYGEEDNEDVSDGEDEDDDE